MTKRSAILTASKSGQGKSVVRFGTGTKTAYLGGSGSISQSPPSSRTSVGLVWVRFLFRNLMNASASDRGRWRKKIAEFLMRASPECIDELLMLCTTQAGPDGLDVAIDVLSKTKSVVLEYARDYLCRDISKWTPDTDRAYKPNDDHWYVLLRSVGRADLDAKDRFEFINCCSGAESRGIREGVVEGLGDLGSPKARDRLQKLAQHDPDSYIRKIALETLADLES